MLAVIACLCGVTGYPHPPSPPRGAHRPIGAGEIDFNQRGEPMDTQEYKKRLQWDGSHASWKDTGYPSRPTASET